jgi:hypothetical protein
MLFGQSEKRNSASQPLNPKPAAIMLSGVNRAIPMHEYLNKHKPFPVNPSLVASPVLPIS